MTFSAYVAAAHPAGTAGGTAYFVQMTPIYALHGQRQAWADAFTPLLMALGFGKGEGLTERCNMVNEHAHAHADACQAQASAEQHLAALSRLTPPRVMGDKVLGAMALCRCVHGIQRLMNGQRRHNGGIPISTSCSLPPPLQACQRGLAVVTHYKYLRTAAC